MSNEDYMDRIREKLKDAPPLTPEIKATIRAVLKPALDRVRADRERGPST